MSAGISSAEGSSVSKRLPASRKASSTSSTGVEGASEWASSKNRASPSATSEARVDSLSRISWKRRRWGASMSSTSSRISEVERRAATWVSIRCRWSESTGSWVSRSESASTRRAASRRAAQARGRMPAQQVAGVVGIEGEVGELRLGRDLGEAVGESTLERAVELGGGHAQRAGGARDQVGAGAALLALDQVEVARRDSHRAGELGLAHAGRAAPLADAETDHRGRQPASSMLHLRATPPCVPCKGLGSWRFCGSL